MGRLSGGSWCTSIQDVVGDGIGGRVSPVRHLTGNIEAPLELELLSFECVQQITRLWRIEQHPNTEIDVGLDVVELLVGPDEGVPRLRATRDRVTAFRTDAQLVQC